MITSTTTLTTHNAHKYLDEIIIHFDRRAQISRNGAKVQITLLRGRCNLTATESAISARVEASHKEIAQVEAFFGGWIERLAFREKATLTWHRSTST